jgi:hypothetical protein
MNKNYFFQLLFYITEILKKGFVLTEKGKQFSVHYFNLSKIPKKNEEKKR